MFLFSSPWCSVWTVLGQHRLHDCTFNLWKNYFDLISLCFCVLRAPRIRLSAKLFKRWAHGDPPELMQQVMRYLFYRKYLCLIDLFRCHREAHCLTVRFMAVPRPHCKTSSFAVLVLLPFPRLMGLTRTWHSLASRSKVKDRFSRLDKGRELNQSQPLLNLFPDANSSVEGCSGAPFHTTYVQRGSMGSP